MSMWADTDALAELAERLRRSGESLRQEADSSVAVLAAHGHDWAATVAGSSADWVTTWAAEWRASLLTRITMLEAADPLPLGGPLRWASLNLDRRRLVAGVGERHPIPFGPPLPGPPRGDAESGRRLAADLIEGLESGEAAGVLAVLEVLDTVADEPATAVAFLAGLRLDLLRVLPAILTHDLGIPVGDLHRYLGPMGRTLATASAASDPSWFFDGAELMAGEAGSPLGPAVYFDFGIYDPDFLVDAAVAFLPTFADLPLMLASPHYRLPDGGYAGDDPRGALLRALDGADSEVAVELATRLGSTGGLGALIRPATAWRPGEAELVGRLLAKLSTSDGGQPTTEGMHAVRLAIVAGGGGRVDPAVALGLAAMVAPQAASLGKAEQKTSLPGSSLRAELDEIDPERTTVVAAFMDTVVPHDEARLLLSQAVAALVMATLRDRFDPDDVEPMLLVTDDLGAAWKVLEDAAVRADLQAARRADADAGLAVLLVAAAVAAAPVFLPAMGTAAGIVASVAPGTAVTLLAPDADAAEQVPLDHLRQLENIGNHANFVLAVILHERGLIRLPEPLVEGGRVVVPTSEEGWGDLTAALQQSEFDTEVWLNAIAGIPGYAIPDVDR